MSRVAFPVIGASFLAGVAARSLFDPGIFFSFLFAAAGVLFVWLLYAKEYWGLARSPLVIAALACLSLAGGLVRMEYELRGVEPVLDRHRGEIVVVYGRVAEDPLRTEGYTRYAVSVEEMNGRAVPVAQKILVYDKTLSSQEYGTWLTLTGRLSVPENFYDSSRTSNFNWPAYLARRGIFYEMFYPDIVAHDTHTGFYDALKVKLYRLRNAFAKNIQSVVPEPEASLVAGETVGARGVLGDALEDLLRRTGIIHVVVLSGYNITIIADAVVKTLRVVPAGASFALSVAAVLLFTIMTGASPTIVRAAIMAVLVLVARRYGSLYSIPRALLAAAVLMVFFNPLLLVYDLSFQLSFLATLGLIYAAPHLESRMSIIPRAWGMRGIVAATLGTQLLVLPLLVVTTGMISLVSVPVNVLVLPMVPVTMFLGFLSGTAGFVWADASWLVGLFAGVFARAQLEVASWFDTAAAVREAVPEVALPLLVVFYVCILFLTIHAQRPRVR